MRTIDQIYIDGAFVTPHGLDSAPLFNPATETEIGSVRLGDVEDARDAIAAAKRALPDWAATDKAQRAALLRRMSAAVAERRDALVAAIMLEYGAPQALAGVLADMAVGEFREAADTLEAYIFTRTLGHASVTMVPLGVVAAITPWNSNAGFMARKIGYALAAGCTVVAKPSEMSALQTQVFTEALHAAGAPAGVFNIVTGLGDVVGAEFSRHPDVAKVTFTGSTGVGRAILRAAAETFKRVTLELGGKGPQILLDDVDLAAVMPGVVAAGFTNNGQACMAGTRILTPYRRMDETLERLAAEVAAVKVGPPTDRAVTLGPLVSARQWDRVQSYIRLGVEEGAQAIVGGEGRPEGLNAGWYARPTVFAGVTNAMRIAREEIFGPVLSVIGYDTDEEAIAIANDTAYGLQAYVLSADDARAHSVAGRLESGRVMINGAHPGPHAPFGGFKSSGIGRERGVFGLEAFLEPRAVFG